MEATDRRSFHNGTFLGFGDQGIVEAKAKHSWAETLGPTLLTASGQLAPTEEVLAGKKQVALYFSGSWCPWCRALAPKFEDTITKVKAMDADDTEVVYIPADSDADAFAASFAGKPWPAMPYERAQGIDQQPLGFIRKKIREEQGKPMGTLQDRFKLTALPRIVVLDGETGEVKYESFLKEVSDKAADGHEFAQNAPVSWLSAL
mmetsp:Transcript_125340/g.351002  ORF Transcript_125340/g.351002 Transcript_125340/m.351002 type:complete len:204 (+) Transcript_125340:155-766(+)